MGGFMGWFLTFLLVLAIFNAEKLPELRAKLEEKIKDSVDAAKEGSKLASDKIKQVKSDIENKKNAVAAPEEAEENTPEEIEESLKFMGNYLKQEAENNSAQKNTEITDTPIVDGKAETEKKQAEIPSTETDDDKPIDLENRY